MSEHSVIYILSSNDPEREWCREGVWKESVRYNLGTDFDAQRLRADTAETEVAALREELAEANIEVGSQRHFRKSAEQRIASTSELLKKFFEFVEMAPVSSGVCCCGSDTSQANHGDHMAVDQWDHSVSLWGREIDAALNPNPEAESHE